MSKRAGGWYDMERQYGRKKVPQPVPVTQWQKLLDAIHMREQDALMAVSMPDSLAAKKLRDELRKDGMYHLKYVPEAVIEAFGWKAEVECRIDGDWMGAPRKPKVLQGKAPLFDKVKA